MGLMDIAPPEIVTKKFEIRGGVLEVRGIKTKEWVALLHRFPQLKPATYGQLEEDVVLTAIDGLVPAVIAAGAGVCGDEETERLVVERLSDFEQVTIFSEIMQLTAPPQETKAGPLLVSPEKPETGPLLNGSGEPPTMNTPQLSLL